jgi:hypothetical protein
VDDAGHALGCDRRRFPDHFRKGHAGQQFVGVKAAPGVRDGFIDGADQRMVHRRLGAHIREDLGLVAELAFP